MKHSGSILAKVAWGISLFLLVVFCIGLAGVAAGIIALAFISDFAIPANNVLAEVPTRGELIALLAAVALFLILLISLMGRLLRVLQTVSRGDPFHPSNPRNLYWIAGLLAATEIVSNLIGYLAPHMVNHPYKGPEFDMTPWLSVLIVVVLAEVFREGSRLRADAELTV